MIDKNINNLIRIKELSLDDLKFRVSVLNDSDVRKGISIEEKITYENTLIWFNKRDLTKRLDFIIYKNKARVGIIGLTNINYKNKNAELYIAIPNKKNHNKDIGSLALKMLLEIGFNNLKLNKIYLFTYEDNLIAQKFYEKNNFKLEGILRDYRIINGKFKNYYYYGLLKKDWRQKN